MNGAMIARLKAARQRDIADNAYNIARTREKLAELLDERRQYEKDLAELNAMEEEYKNEGERLDDEDNEN